MQCALWVWLSGLLPHVNKSQKAELSNLTGIFWKRIWDLREEQIQFLRLAEEVKTVRDETEVMEYAFRGEKDIWNGELF